MCPSYEVEVTEQARKLETVEYAACTIFSFTRVIGWMAPVQECELIGNPTDAVLISRNAQQKCIRRARGVPASRAPRWVVLTAGPGSAR